MSECITGPVLSLTHTNAILSPQVMFLSFISGYYGLISIYYLLILCHQGQLLTCRPVIIIWHAMYLLLSLERFFTANLICCSLQVAQYVTAYLGNSQETMSFIQQYWEKRECFRKQDKMIQVDNFVCYAIRHIQYRNRSCNQNTHCLI